MKYRPRIYYTETDKALMWDRWQQGDSLHSIARLFDRGHSSIQCILGETEGIRPADKKRSSLTLRLSEREEISRGIAADHSFRAIAEARSRAPSTVSRARSRQSKKLRKLRSGNSVRCVFLAGARGRMLDYWKLKFSKQLQKCQVRH